ncbi:MAG: hypothetical protein A07HB70_01394 [uncultured archaeon A07HB70]|nr:MAG: hypothetical protein A07HB70_01394 [uncultured archaeon A07HB70]
MTDDRCPVHGLEPVETYHDFGAVYPKCRTDGGGQ